MRRGFTLLELVITVLVLMVIINFAVPQYRVAMEQNRVDLAGSRLLMIYTAQRMYFVDNQTFAPTLGDLINAKLLDPALSTGESKFAYSISGATASAFTATATRLSTPVPQFFSGDLTINERGVLGGNVHSADSSIVLTASKYALGL
jgi:prepilin-type N-terminal cleavage/methylation domain-containing protein